MRVISLKSALRNMSVSVYTINDRVEKVCLSSDHNTVLFFFGGGSRVKYCATVLPVLIKQYCTVCLFFTSSL